MREKSGSDSGGVLVVFNENCVKNNYRERCHVSISEWKTTRGQQ